MKFIMEFGGGGSGPSGPPSTLLYRQPVGSVGGAPDYCAGDRGSIPGRTNTQGLKIIEEKVLPL